MQCRLNVLPVMQEPNFFSYIIKINSILQRKGLNYQVHVFHWQGMHCVTTQFVTEL